MSDVRKVTVLPNDHVTLQGYGSAGAEHAVSFRGHELIEAMRPGVPPMKRIESGIMMLEFLKDVYPDIERIQGAVENNSKTFRAKIGQSMLRSAANFMEEYAADQKLMRNLSGWVRFADQKPEGNKIVLVAFKEEGAEVFTEYDVAIYFTQTDKWSSANSGHKIDGVTHWKEIEAPID